MTLSTGQRRQHFKNTIPTNPAIAPLVDWPLPNRSFLAAFKGWLKSSGYGPSTLNAYSVATRLALGYLNKPFWTIDPDKDLEQVSNYIVERYDSLSTRAEYGKGLRKLAEYLRLRRDKTTCPKRIRWEYHLNGLPNWLCEHVREYLAHRQKGWRPEDRHTRLTRALSEICYILRWMMSTSPLNGVGDFTPQLWFDFVDARLVAGSSILTINTNMFHLQSFLRFLDETGVSICHRMLLVPSLQTGTHLPKDARIADLRLLMAENEREIQKSHANQRRMGLMDRAWLSLMLYSGLRTCEIRRLRECDIQWDDRRIRIEQSKGLKDRMVYLNSATLKSLQT